MLVHGYQIAFSSHTGINVSLHFSIPGLKSGPLVCTYITWHLPCEDAASSNFDRLRPQRETILF